MSNTMYSLFRKTPLVAWVWVRSLSLTLIFVLIASITPHAFAQENVRYITDVLYVPLRSGQGNQYRIINSSLKSGAKLFVIEEGDSGEWSKVRTESATEGWIPNQYLSANEPSRLTLARAQAQIATLTKHNKTLTSENHELKSSNAELGNTASKASQAQSKMAEELQSIKTLSSGAIELEKRYTAMVEKHQLLQTENDVLTAENEKLRNDNRVNFMLYGVGILLIGVILAYLIPALKPKKRYAEWS